MPESPSNARAWISIVTSAGAFLVSALSIYLGYKLFEMGAKGEFKFSAGAGGASVGMESVAPGLAFALFGALLAGVTVSRLIAKS